MFKRFVMSIGLLCINSSYAMNNSKPNLTLCLRFVDNVHFRPLVCLASHTDYKEIEVKVLHREAKKILDWVIDEKMVNNQISTPVGISCKAHHLGKTMLHLCLELHASRVCDMSSEITKLYNNGADFDIKDQDQVSPCDLIRKNNVLHDFKIYLKTYNISPIIFAHKDTRHFLSECPLDIIKEIYRNF